MIDLARANAPAGSFVVATVHSVAIPACVVVTALGEGITYFSKDSDEVDLAQLVARVAEALVPGGLLVFDVVEHRPDAPMRYETEREGSGWRLTVEVREDPAHRVLTRTIRVSRELAAGTRSSIEIHRLRTFERQEVVNILESAGFDATVTRAYGAMPLPPYRMGFIANTPRHDGRM